ncbi:hypothetical protein Acr_22g0009730 [Actinidia rufa]|uniref:Uncharacterized protein n=1 Tax=Actinidia rufa TaxID=165716 RepID=A0A7J0GLC0_9ERIC|nr:hypothetical protein Acr_22g0009730 [Actinidia rufa]
MATGFPLAGEGFAELSVRAERVGLEVKATNFPIVGKRSVAASSMSDVADFSPVRKRCYEA